MAEKKKPVRKATVVSPSRRGEGSKAKRPASTSAKTVARGRATIKKKSAEGPKRSTANIYTNPRVVEAGVGNLPMTVARAAVAVGKKIKGQQAPKAKPTIAKGQIKKTQPTSSQIKRAKDYGLTTKKEIEAFAAADRGKFLAAAERTAAKKSSNARQAAFQREEAKAQSYANAKKQPKVSKEKSTTAQFKGKRMTDQFGNSGWR